MKRKNFTIKCHIINKTFFLSFFLVFLLGLPVLNYAAYYDARDVVNEDEQRDIINADDVSYITKADDLGILNYDLPNRTGVKIGDVVFHSGLKVSNQYDSNIFLTPTKVGAKSDNIYIINPYLGFRLPMGDNSFSLEYDPTFNYYYKFPVLNHVDQRVAALGEINLEDFKINFNDTYRNYRDRTGTEDINFTHRQSNVFSMNVDTKDFNRFFFSFGYRNDLEDMLSNELIYGPLTYRDRSYIENTFYLAANYRIATKTYLIWENDYGFINYYHSDIPPDSYYIESLVGVKGQPSSKIAVNLKVGVKYQQYDSSPLIYDGGYCNFVARGGIDYFATQNDTLSLNLERTDYESTYANMNYYQVSSLGLNYKHSFPHKFTSNLFASLQQNLYPTETTENGVYATRKDWIYEGGCSLKYDVKKWLALEARYDFERRDSIFSNFSYTDNRITISGTVGF